MKSFLSVRPVRCIAALIVVAAVAGCTKPIPNIDVQLASYVPSGEGVAVIMDLMSCSVNRDVLAALDSISRISGVTMSAVLVRTPPSQADRDAVVAALGVAFPVRWDTTTALVSAIRTAGYPLPIIGVVSRGKLETVAWGHGFRTVATEVVNHYGGRSIAGNVTTVGGRTI